MKSSRVVLNKILRKKKIEPGEVRPDSIGEGKLKMKKKILIWLYYTYYI